jgi:hypothetical protein
LTTFPAFSWYGKHIVLKREYSIDKIDATWVIF